ncbi:MAG TPA: RES family NAD+ phosphorylase [Opitutaceae bacterium]
MLAFRIGSVKHAGIRQAAYSGHGSLHGDGRWHHRGRPAVYASSHQSLALLELLIHLDRKNQIRPHVGWVIDVPDEALLDPSDLPADWMTNIDATRSYGDAWLASRSSVCLRVPSIIVPAELNVVINPAHPDFDLAWVIRGPERIEIDHRFV